jgi:HAD superfamily hydrolase (TIGR01549 family)
VSAASRAPPAAVLVDLDDTIFDHSFTVRAAIVALRRTRSFLRRRPLDELWQEYLRRVDDDTPQVAIGKLAPLEARRARWRAVAAECGASLEAEDADRLADEYRALYQRLRRPVPGAPEAVRALHRKAGIAVITNHTAEEQGEKLRFLGLDRAVNFLVTPEEVGVTKPEPEIFRAALDRLGVGPEEATMIGDRWDSDILGAFAAGIPPIWFNRFHRARPSPIPVGEFESWVPVPDLSAVLAARSGTAGGSRGPPAPRGL